MYHISSEKRLLLSLEILAGISRGCEYIHGKEIIHGDLKPDNVLLAQTHEYPGITPKVRVRCHRMMHGLVTYGFVDWMHGFVTYSLDACVYNL